MIEFYCFHCGIKISTDLTHANSSAFCPSCGRAIIVPETPSSLDGIETSDVLNLSPQVPRTKPPPLPPESATSQSPPPLPMCEASVPECANGTLPQPASQALNSPSSANKKSGLTVFGLPFGVYLVIVLVVSVVKLCSGDHHSKQTHNYDDREEPKQTPNYEYRESKKSIQQTTSRDEIARALMAKEQNLMLKLQSIQASLNSDKGRNAYKLNFERNMTQQELQKVRGQIRALGY